MPTKRRKRSPTPNKGLAPGESLKRYLVPTRNLQSPLWTWVGTEVSRATDITPEHCLMAYGLAARNKNPFCKNKYALSRVQVLEETEPREDDIIVVSDDEEAKCTKRSCKDNPNCLNYLGQDSWEDEENAMTEFLNMATGDFNPTTDKRESDLPVGLRNLGATCYANASLQVWFRILAFRKCVYQCQSQTGTAVTPEDSPLFQLQVTFAALQESSRKVFNPTRLVESLQLRASEQQDAQEFSKLFMSLLDSEFKKQSVPELCSLVSDQFQGTQVYGTVCDSCGYRSERTTDFLEIGVRFERNSQLEDCVKAMLHEEKLTGDNQYRCPQCDDLRDATRYTQLTQLPPILHFSLLRFIYDYSTMERKKSKHTISFPTILDMNQFLERGAGGTAQEQEDNVYELAGILLHKGASAYHGHYEAQVYDTERQSWFQFNDEVVTRIKTLGDKKSAKGVPNVENNINPPSESNQAKRSAKRRRIVTGDEDISGSEHIPRTITSKDAYMLIYVRRSIQRNKKIQIPMPSPQALEFTHDQNRDHEEECRSFIQKEDSIKESFVSIRQRVADIYRTWNARSIDDDCVVVNQQWLQKWLTQDCIHLTKPPSLITEPETCDKPAEPTDESSPIKPDDRIRCVHHKLDPTQAKNMKRVRRSAYQGMIELTGGKYEPPPSPEDVCQDCVFLEFQERLYNLEHPKLVKEFDEISEAEGDALGYWISKKWLKDWRLSKPKMHKASAGDPAPDSPEYREQVLCGHGALALNSLHRRKISEPAAHLLRNLFPSWELVSSGMEPCAICDALVQVSKEDKRESKRRAEEEKALLKFMYEGVPFTEQDDTFAVVPTEFFNGWQSWLTNPADHTRPDRLDTSPFLCEHALLILDPNCPSDIEMIATIIRRADWDVLQTLYDAGPRINLRKVSRNDGSDKTYESDILVCESCCLKRKTDWVTADITVQLLRGQKTETSTNRQPIATYSGKNGTRQSKRLRQSRESEKRRFMVTKKTTIKDIRMKIQEEYKIPTICQRLFFRGQELQDNEVTVDDLQMCANEILDLREENEVHGSDSDFEGQPFKKQRRETERGFGGTVLSGRANGHEPSQCQDSNPSSREGVMPTGKVCTVCTLLNVHNAVACQVCDTLFV